MSEVSLETIVSLCKRRGFIYQGSDIYGGLAGTWDWGPLGVQLKRNISNLWWKTFVEDRDDMYGMDAAILMNQKVWQTSGHVGGFNDPLFECNNCKNRFRADHLVEDWIEKHPDEAKTAPKYEQSPETLNTYKNQFEFKCPNCGKQELSDVRQFNMMFKTHVGAVGPQSKSLVKVGGEAEISESADSDLDDDGYPQSSVSYLRPETAQGMFVNFKNVVDSFYPDIPFGMAQIGKAFRNEIAPRDFIFRVRELEQMEIEVFIHPDSWKEEFDKWLELQKQFLLSLGLPEAGIHQLEIGPEDRAHYSKHSVDTEFDFPFGQKELLGCAYRTDYDLSKHQEASGKNLEYRPKGEGGAPFIPHVIEPTFGLDRLFLAVVASAYTEDEINGEKRAYLKLPANLAPVKVAVLPLVKNKPELVAKAREVYAMLKKEIGNVMWVDTGNIGKNYRKMDEIGVPYCVTIDFDTMEGDRKDTVTVRNRDTMEQIRVFETDLKKIIEG